MAEDRFHFQIPIENIRSENCPKHGGGENYARTDYSVHGKKLWQDSNAIKITEAKRKDFNLISDLFLLMEMPQDIPIKNHKLRIQHLGFELINYSTERRSIGVVKISKLKFEELDEKLVEYIQSPTNVGKSYFSVIENLSSIPVENKITDVDTSDNQELSVVLNLYHGLQTKEKFAINQAISSELKRINVQAEEKTFANGSSSISCILKADQISLVADEFSSIRDVKINQTALVENAIDTQNLPNPLKISKPKSNSKICVIDSGVNNSSGLFDNILTGSLAYLPTGAVNGHYRHGTFVASRCVFGDNIDACLGTHYLEPYCKIIDVQIFGVGSAGQRINPSEFHVRTMIEKVVIDLHKTVKVYNLSFGFPNSIRDNEFSETAKLLDYLSKKYKVLFIVASGNIRKLLGLYPSDHFSDPLARIGSPAESILAVTVGAVSKHEDTNSLSKRDQLAPFSKIGPGADLGLKPEVVAHGGNLIVQYDRSPRVSTYGISSDGKHLAVDVGTSFAAPLVAQYAQRLFDAYPDGDPNLIKALLYHFTSNREHPVGLADGYRCTGFGEPIIELATLAGPHSAAFIFEGKLDKDNYQHIGFHIPKTLAANNKNARLEIRVTLVYDPPVDPNNNAEYSKTRISLSLKKPNRHSVGIVGFSNKANYLVPWNPIIRCKKVFTKNYIPGNWDLRLRLYTRGGVSPRYLQDYAVVIEVVDKKMSTDVYRDLATEYGSVYKKFRIKTAA